MASTLTVGQLIGDLRATPDKFARVHELLQKEANKQAFSDAVRTAGGITHFAQAIGLTTHSHIGKVLREAGVDYNTHPADLLAVGADPLSYDVSYWRRKAEQACRERDNLLEVYANLGQVMADTIKEHGIEKAVDPYYQFETEGLADEEIAMIFISDTHLGELVLSEHTSGLSQYNKDIFLDRCEAYKRALDSLVNRHLRRVYPLKKAFVVLLGDHVSGDSIFPLQPHRIDRSLFQQITEGAMYLSSLLRYIAGMFEEVWVYAVPGNHGRTKDSPLNTDYLLYHFMGLLLANQPNLHMVVSDSETMAIYVDESLGILDWPEKARDKSYSFLFTHGNACKGYNGIPYYGLDRYVQRITGTTGIVFDHVFAGHFHTQASTANWTLVGSWVGGTDYSFNRLQSASRPTQLICGLHAGRGLTWSFPIYLDEEPHLTKENASIPGVYTPANSTVDKLVKSMLQ